jgi:hypothetical protein
VLTDASKRPDGVHLSYDRMASFLSPYGNAEALKVAGDLDAKVEALLSVQRCRARQITRPGGSPPMIGIGRVVAALTVGFLLWGTQARAQDSSLMDMNMSMGCMLMAGMHELRVAVYQTLIVA